MADNPFAESPDFYENRLKDGRAKGEFDGCLHNVLLVFEYDQEWSGVIALDEFRQEIVKLKPPPFFKKDKEFEVSEWTETDDVRAASWLTENKKITATTGIISQAVKAVAEENKFHAVREWLESLEWDGEKRVGELLTKYFGVSNRDKVKLSKYHWLVSRMFMIGAVARMFRPGCKFDNVMILEGKEGIKKSTGLKILFFNDDWFTDTPFRLGDKEGYQSMRGKWIIELSELISFLNAPAGAQRAFFSSSTDNFRSSYGKKNHDYPRQSVFVGTTNEYEYFMDANNRRYWPVYCSRVDVEAIEQDRVQLWAEAVHLFKEGTHWWPDDEDKLIFEEQQAMRAADDIYFNHIDAWLQNLPTNIKEGEDGNIITMEKIVSQALQIPRDKQHDRRLAIQVGKIMSELGYQKKQATSRAQRKLGRFHYVKREY